MGAKSSRKGAAAEREAAGLLTELLGVDVRRALGAGRMDDVGDLDGVSRFAVQVAARAAFAQAARQKPKDAELQAGNRGVDFGVALLKLPPQPGGQPADWIVAMTPATFAEIWRELQDGRSFE